MEYGKFTCFNQKNNIEIKDINNRNETYQTNQFRIKLKSKYSSYTEYIKASLRLR